MAIKYEKTVEDIQATAVRPGRNPQNVARVKEDSEAQEMMEALQRNNVLMEETVNLMKDMKSSLQQRNNGQRRYTRSNDGCWECGGDHFRRDCPNYHAARQSQQCGKSGLTGTEGQVSVRKDVCKKTQTRSKDKHAAALNHSLYANGVVAEMENSMLIDSGATRQEVQRNLKTGQHM